MIQRRSRIWIVGLIGALGIAGLLATSLPTKSAPKAKQTLAFVVTHWDNAHYESKFADECPAGNAVGNDEYWWRGLSRTDRDKLTDRGLVQPVDRKNHSIYRGPHGEDVCWHPTVVKDPPLRTVRSEIAYGFNLDGTDDGHATAKSCKHEKFRNVDGAGSVDHQMYRILGCQYGWRHYGTLDQYDDEERRNSGRGVLIIEITGIDDVRNSDHVTVAFYRVTDPFPIDSSGKIIPYASYRIDYDGTKPRYGTPIPAKIVDGILTTEVQDMSLPFYGNATYAEIRLRDTHFKLDLTDASHGATGLLGGYYDFDKWWEYMLKVEFLVATGDWSCPAVYEASKRLADGYPDPATGECTAISTAFKVDAIPAFVIHQNEMAAN